MGLLPVLHAPTVLLLTWGSSSPWPHQPQGTEGERAMPPTSTHHHQHWDLSWSWGARDPAPGPLVARSPATAWPTLGAGARAGGQATHREPAASRGGGRAGRGAGPRPGPGLVLGSGAGTGKGSPGAGWWHRRWPGSAPSPSHPGELRDQRCRGLQAAELGLRSPRGHPPRTPQTPAPTLLHPLWGHPSCCSPSTEPGTSAPRGCLGDGSPSRGAAMGWVLLCSQRWALRPALPGGRGRAFPGRGWEPGRASVPAVLCGNQTAPGHGSAALASSLAPGGPSEGGG